MKEKLTLLIVLVMCWACAKPESTPETWPEITSGVTMESMPVVSGLSIDIDILKSILEEAREKRVIAADIQIVFNGKEYFFTLEDFTSRLLVAGFQTDGVYANLTRGGEIFIDIDTIRARFKEVGMDGTRVLRIKVTSEGKEYFFTLDGFLKHIE
jgi:YHS domain-containing protein